MEFAPDTTVHDSTLYGSNFSNRIESGLVYVSKRIAISRFGSDILSHCHNPTTRRLKRFVIDQLAINITASI